MSEDTYIVEASNQEINGEMGIAYNFVKKITEEDTLQYEKSMHVIKNWHNFHDLYESFMINSVDLLTYITEVRDAVRESGMAYEEFDMNGVFLNINRLLLNLLTMGRTFYDHGIVNFGETFGKSSNELTEYKLIFNKLYDDYFSYRFIYKLRNYAQHCGMPCLTVTSSSSIENESTDFDLLIKFNSFQLLSRYDSWGKPLNEELKVMENFSLEDCVIEYINSITSSMASINKIFYPHISESWSFILRLLNHDGGEFTKGYAFCELPLNESEEPPSSISLNLRWIPLHRYSFYKDFLAKE
jgi:hypothetical protein